MSGTAVLQAWFEHEASLGTNPNAPLQRYLGLWNGEPVATCATFSAAGVVGLYHRATLPRVRGNGIGTAVLLTALQEARRFNHQFGVSLTTLSEKILDDRLGFQAINEFNFYRWQPTNQNS